MPRPSADSPRRFWIPLLGLGLSASCARPAPTWPAVLREVRERHPEVRQVSDAALRERLASATPPLLLDAREDDEFFLGHLKGARPARDLGQALVALGNSPPEREIVIYCSVGMRSSALAAELAEHGFTNVANLEGGIFAWANAGGATYVRDREDGSETRVDVVHPFDRRWGTLLDPQRHAPAR